MSEQASNPAEATPLPRIVIDRGAATPEEIATLLVLFAAASGGDMSTDPQARGGWTRKVRTFNAGAVRGAGWGGGL
ncbi:MAG: hypothetical protein M9891_16750 [Austwickia sp.]|nr:hypothetical protein [Actinomycetota bacterium]MCB1252398.1 acyl-CoA carboxylase subunit epsilon [Austwickia sp.]MCO5310903.1 hypothetical protein [Austwickia sp.]